MHDRNGTSVKNGDTCIVEGVIVGAYACDDYCNVTIQIGHGKPHGPDNVQSSVTLNARQLLLVKRAE